MLHTHVKHSNKPAAVVCSLRRLVFPSWMTFDKLLLASWDKSRGSWPLLRVLARACMDSWDGCFKHDSRAIVELFTSYS